MKIGMVLLGAALALMGAALQNASLGLWGSVMWYYGMEHL